MKSKDTLKILSFLLLLEGLPVFLMLFKIPSEEESVVFLGFSLSRLLLGIGFGVVLLLLLILSLSADRNSGWIKRVIHWGEEYLSSKTQLLFTIILLASFTFVGISAIVFFSSPAGRVFGPLYFIYERSASILYWATLAFFQCLLIILIKTRDTWRKAGFFEPSFISRYVVVFIIIAFTVIHWTIILLQLPIFSDIIPFWWMRYRPKELSYRDLFIIGAFISVIVLTRSIIKFPKRSSIHLLYILILGYILQVGLAFIDGGGYEVLRQKLVDSNHNRYAVNAVPDLNYARAIRLYEERYANDRILSTKPPGSLIFYISMEKLANLGNHSNDPQLRYLNLIDFASFSFPFIAILCVPIIFLLGRKFISAEFSSLSSLLFILTPSFLLIQLQLDQFLYPLLFALGIYFFEIVISSRRIIFAFGMGAFIYIALFMSFSLIPLPVLLVAYLGIRVLFGEFGDRRIEAVKLLFFIGLGFLLLYALFRFFLDYDFLSRYVKAIEYHRQMKLFEPGLSQVLSAILLNNLEFAMWSGVPLILLSLSRIMRAITHLVRKNLFYLDFMAIAFLIMLIGLNIFGQTRGEVGHIWMFLLPLLCIFSVDEVKYLLKGKSVGMEMFITAQLITSYLNFKLQDFF